MCGIFGTFGVENQWQKKLLALRNEARGNGSVGFWADGLRFRIPEGLGDAMLHGRVPKTVWTANVMVGHTRGPSTGVGGVCKENTHPFKVGNIIGAHNGYIANWWALKEKYKKDYPFVTDYHVDSQMIFFLLNYKGFDGLEELKGWAGCWWIDERVENKLFLWVCSADLWVHDIAKNTAGAFSSNGNDLKLSGFPNVSKFTSDGQIISIDLKTFKYELVDKIEIKRPEAEKPLIQVGGKWVREEFDFENGCRADGSEFLPVHYRKSYSVSNQCAPPSQAPVGFPIIKDWNKRIWFGDSETGGYVYPDDANYKEAFNARENAAKASAGIPTAPSDEMGVGNAGVNGNIIIKRFRGPNHAKDIESVVNDKEFILTSQSLLGDEDSFVRMYEFIMHWQEQSAGGKIGAFFFCWECEDWVVKTDFDKDTPLIVDEKTHSWICPKCNLATSRIPWESVRMEVYKIMHIVGMIESICEIEGWDPKITNVCEDCMGTGIAINPDGTKGKRIHECRECNPPGIVILDAVVEGPNQVENIGNVGP